MGPSQNLSWSELACKDGTPYPEKWHLERATKLAGVFELIRRECGDKPITILSAYRSPKHNRSIGGAKFSQHVEGRALDLKPPKGLTVKQLHDLILALSKTSKGRDIRGIGLYKTFVHVDIRPTLSLAHWTGSGVKDS